MKKDAIKKAHTFQVKISNSAYLAEIIYIVQFRIFTTTCSKILAEIKKRFRVLKRNVHIIKRLEDDNTEFEISKFVHILSLVIS